jgi:hypothetical protein
MTTQTVRISCFRRVLLCKIGKTNSFEKSISLDLLDIFQKRNGPRKDREAKKWVTRGLEENKGEVTALWLEQ